MDETKGKSSGYFEATPETPLGLPQVVEAANLPLNRWACCARPDRNVKGCIFFNDRLPGPTDVRGGCIFRQERGKTGPFYLAVEHVHSNNTTRQFATCWQWMQKWQHRRAAGHRMVTVMRNGKEERARAGDLVEFLERVPNQPGNLNPDKTMKTVRIMRPVPDYPAIHELIPGVIESLEAKRAAYEESVATKVETHRPSRLKAESAT